MLTIQCFLLLLKIKFITSLLFLTIVESEFEVTRLLSKREKIAMILANIIWSVLAVLIVNITLL